MSSLGIPEAEAAALSTAGSRLTEVQRED
jgi:hypothetical protein